jgi:hypothetical protein
MSPCEQFFYDHWGKIITIIIIPTILGVLWLYKLRPSLEIEFCHVKLRTYKSHRLTMRTPQLHIINFVVRYFDTSKRVMYYTHADFRNPKLISRKTIRKLEIYEAIKGNKFIGPWFLTKKSNKYWFIFHFRDDRWWKLKNDWCYCKRFKFDDNMGYKWDTERKQIRCKLTGIHWQPKECKNCKFKREWDNGNWDLLR